MKQYVSRFDFQDAFLKSETYKNNFSYEGLNALFDYLEEYEEETGEEIDFDMVALCCDYSEYASAWEAMEQYQPDDMPTVDDSEGMDQLEVQEASEKLALEWLQDRTQTYSFDKGIIVQQF